MSVCKLRDENGKLPTYAWPGGYPIFYLDTENNTLCPNCANKEGFSPIKHADIHWEGGPLYCDDCSMTIESAYGEEES